MAATSPPALLTLEEARAQLEARGESVAGFARRKNVKANAVYQVLYGAKKGGDDLHLATGYRAARAPFRSVALRHRLSPAVPFSVQLLFCEPHRYLCLPIFYVHSIPDLPKNARKFSKNT